MNKLFKSTITAAVLSVMSVASASADVTADGVRFIGDTEFAGFCKAVVKDDVRLLRTSVSRNIGLIGASQREVLKVVKAENGVTCNGVSLVEFSQSRDASNVYQFLTARS
ncbi:DUF3718 domain-containing protein [Alteromonas gilva]|uniref:DUF3718 domain-containing protein n=1 Tax=Alteromonas gilva TaxID=2987522 RepID=A0ABT5L2H4_9ALTE|nr:DUF3718 domain-containing protein [Alteromonas gilva]MDC8831235.1 DUF3718 domain-containing protein [Alteromonas gilva]